ncbi:hypothetical protein BLNAU_8108 [Blattamonas nauphoetae]|uniref:Uncharacterized protein n=1 Tax=Blattamonas nauphoetae TaxID=2049346 RepID=A0ABQ9XZV5_9EUKA|nr:hypothetical protein BLNAU_8108 [Blattamonas nauphoetae]
MSTEETTFMMLLEHIPTVLTHSIGFASPELREFISQCFLFIRHAIQYKMIPQVVADCFRLLDFLLDASAEATIETHNSVHLKDQDLRWVVSSDGAPKTFILGRTDVFSQQELVRAINQLMAGLNDCNDMFPRVFHSQLIRLADPLYLKKKADGHEQASFHLVCNNPEWDVFFACLRLLFEPIIRIDLQIDGRERELKEPEVQNWRILQQELYDKAFLVVKELVQNKQEFVDVYRPHLLVMFENDRKGNLFQLVSDSSCIDVGKAVETMDSWDSEICGFLRWMRMRKKKEGTKDDVEAGQQMREHFEKDAQIRQFLSYSYYPNPTLRMYQQQSIAIEDITASFTFYMEQGQCGLLNLNTIHPETQPQLTTLVEHLNRLTDISPPHEYWQGSFPYFMLFLIEEGGRQFLNHLKHERWEVVKQRQAILNGDIEAKTHILECKGALNVMSVI